MPTEPRARARPDPERRARLPESRSTSIPVGAKERLSRIFADDSARRRGPRLRPRRARSRRVPRRPTRARTLPVIRVVGVGGAGVNAINRMIEAQIPGVEFMAINTDLQSLQQSTADVTVHLGSGIAARPRRRLEPRARLPGRVRGAGQDQAPAEGLRHGLRDRRRRWRHRHRRDAGGRAARARRRRADRRHRHQAVRVRGHAPRQAGRRTGSRR